MGSLSLQSASPTLSLLHILAGRCHSHEPPPATLKTQLAGDADTFPLGMQLTVITATGQRHQLDVPQSQLNAADLQAAVARRLGVQAAGLRLVRAGQPLNQDEAISRLRDGGGFSAACPTCPASFACRVWMQRTWLAARFGCHLCSGPSA